MNQIRLKEGMMKLLNNSHGQKGAANMLYVLMGVVIAISVFFAVKYYHDRQNDITIHLPKVEVH